MNLYLRELRKNRRGLVIWTIILSAVIVLVMSVYPSISAESKSFEEMYKTMPEAWLKAFNLDTLNMANLFEYYSMEGYLFITLFGSIYSIILSSSLLSKEEGEKTIEFLLAKPITRSEIVTSKMLCFISNVVILNIVTSITLFITCELFKNQDFSMKMFMLLCVAPMIMHLTFASIGYFISTLIKKKRGILSISLGIVLVTYFFSIASKISDKLEFLKYFTPFEYVDASKIITNKNLDFNYMILMLCLNIIFIGATYLIYKRKDISV